MITGSNGCSIVSNTFNYTTTGIKNNLYAQVMVSPNPASDKLFVTVPENMAGKTMHIFNMLGKKIDTEKLKAGINLYDSSELEPGIYFVTIDNYTTKIVIVK